MSAFYFQQFTENSLVLTAFTSVTCIFFAYFASRNKYRNSYPKDSASDAHNDTSPDLNREIYSSDLNQNNELRQFIDDANAPIFGINELGKIDEWNRMAAKITGFSKEETLGKNIVKEFITDEYKTSVETVLSRALGGVQTDSYEFPLYTKNGERVEVLLNAWTRRNSDGKIAGVLGVGQDVSIATRARAEVERTAKELRQFVETANAPIFGIDKEGLVNEWNQMAETITGFEKEAVIDKDLVSEFITDEYKESVKNVLDRALIGDETADFEFPLYTNSGERVEVLLNASTRRNVEGDIIGVIGVGQDVTRTSRALAEAEQTAKELRQFVETANAPIFGIDQYGRVNEWNQMAEKITNYTKSEVIGEKLVARFITEQYQYSVQDVLDRALNGDETANFEFPLYTKEGDRVEVLLNATTRRDVAGEIIGVLGVGQDITEIRKQERVARQAQKMEVIGQLTGGMAHDFNNLLTVIQGNIGLIVEDMDDADESTREILQDALSAAEDGSNLTQQLLAFARKQPLHTQDVDIDQLINKLSRLVKRTIGQNVDVFVEPNVGVGKLVAKVDSVQLESSLLNLCLNARDAMDGDGVLTLATSKVQITESDSQGFADVSPGKYVCISVSDTGKGMSAEECERAFEPFFTTKDVGAGSGLGLSMVQGFAIQSSGSVSISSVQGEKTTVNLLIPMVDSVENVTAEEPALIVKEVGVYSATILVVEDEPRVRKYAVRCLKLPGVKVIEAEDSLNALEILKSDEHIDLVFSDIILPGELNGRLLAKKISEDFPDIKVKLTTGYEDQLKDDDIEHDILRKPYSRAELIEYISEEIILPMYPVSHDGTK
jgi:PAS domain S-box-containing protein